MYHYVESKDYKPYHFFISDKLNRVKQQILKEHQIETSVKCINKGLIIECMYCFLDKNKEPFMKKMDINLIY